VPKPRRLFSGSGMVDDESRRCSWKKCGGFTDAADNAWGKEIAAHANDDDQKMLQWL
jgi:hypothetical protein